MDFFFLIFLSFLLHGEEGWDKYQVEEDRAGKNEEILLKWEDEGCRHHNMSQLPSLATGDQGWQHRGLFQLQSICSQHPGEYCQVIEVLKNCHSFIIPKSIALKSAPS